MQRKVRKPKISEITKTKGKATYTFFMVTWYDKFGIRQRKQFTDKKSASAFVVDTYTGLLNAGLSRKVLSTVLEESVLRRCELGIERLQGRYDIDEVIEYFLAHHHDPADKIALSDATVRFLGYQEHKVREASLREFKNTLRSFTAFANDCHVHEVSHEMVENFLKSLRAKDGVNPAAPKTWSNNRKSLHRFFGWMIEKPQQFIVTNPVTDTTKKEDKALNEIHSLNAETSERLMRHLETRFPQLVPYFAIALFAGVRPNGEMERLSKKTNAIRLDNGIINITKDVSKTGKARHVTIQPNLQAWLTKFNGPIFPENAEKDITAIRREFGLDEKKFHDVLRHSFISSHVQAFGSFADTALQSGNSETIIRERYYNTLTIKDDALKFWSIAPEEK